MKQTYKIIAIVSMIFIFSMLISFKLPSLKAEPPKIIDFSNITLPSYKLPDNAKITKEEEIKLLSQKLEDCKQGKTLWDKRFNDSRIPTRIQVITIPYGVFTKMFYGDKDKSVLIPNDKIYILIVVDIERTFRDVVTNMTIPYEQMELWEKQGLINSDTPFIYQEYQLIDPETNTVVEWGYNKCIINLPKQN